MGDNIVFAKLILMDMEKNNLNKNIMWLSWFIGFFEGDGNFQIHYKYPNVQSTEMLIDKEYKDEEISAKEIKKPLAASLKTRLGYSINISLSQIDLELLEQIKKLNDFGTIYVYPKRKEARLAFWKKEEVR